MTGHTHCEHFDALRRAVLAYDRALRAHGLFGQQWVESQDLDALHARMLAATGDNSPTTTTPENES